MSRGEQRRLRAKSSQQRSARKAQRRRNRKSGSGSVAAATALALGLAGAPLAPASAAGTDDTAELVVDVRPVGSSEPADLTPFAGAVYFRLDDGTHGSELWKSDGTATGTVLVADIDPGGGSSYPGSLAVAGDTLFFQADDGSGRALWATDGTEAGTVEVAPARSDSASFGAVGNTMFFAAEDEEHGLELWKSDGTTAGTLLVKDIRPGTYDDGYYAYPYSSEPGGFVTAGGTLFFTADDGVQGETLWTSDGTEAGTVKVSEVETGSYYDYYDDQGLTAIGGTVFFQGDDGTNGRELWKSDGTENGTVLVKDIYTGSSGGGYPRSSDPAYLVNVNGVLYFSATTAAGAELWRSDGTAAGTVQVKDVRPGTGGSRPAGFTAAGGKVFFSADDGTHGEELWRTDGTTAGTVLVQDLDPTTYDYYGDPIPNGSEPGGLTAVGGRLVFAATSSTGRELWSSNGTTAGTRVVDVNAGPEGSDPSYLTVAPGGTLLFSAFDDAHGRELFRFVQGTPPPPVTPPSNAFTLPRKGKADTRKGTLTIGVSLPGAGTLKLGPSGKALVKVVSRTVAKGTTSLTIKPTRAGKKQLKKKLAQALAAGRKIGKLKVVVAVTFTPKGGSARTLTKTYTLKLK